MSRSASVDHLMGLSTADAAALGERRAAQIRSFRLLHFLGQELRFLADHLYRADGLTSQQAMLLGIVKAQGKPTLGDAARAFATSHQNVKQIAAVLVKKGLLRMAPDPEDKRRLRLSTTAKNDRYWAARDPDDFAEVSAWFAALSTPEVNALFALLMKLQRGVSNAVVAVEAK